MPISWEQLGALKSASQWTISTAGECLSFQKADPWADHWKSRLTLTAAMRTLRYKPSMVTARRG